MGDIDTAFSHHFYLITIAGLTGDVPSDAENDDGVVKVTASEQG